MRAELLDAIDRSDPRLGDTTLICVDGRSGAGKTDLVTALAPHLQLPLQVLHVDDVVPGWDGLPEITAILAEQVLAPLASRQTARFRGWDWAGERLGPWLRITPGGLLVVEGVGSYVRSAALETSLLVWVDADDGVRKQRALERDGAVFAPHWDAWARSEHLVHQREGTQAAADMVVWPDSQDGRTPPRGSGARIGATVRIDLGP